MRKGQKHTAAARLKLSVAAKEREAKKVREPQESVGIQKLRQRLRIPE